MDLRLVVNPNAGRRNTLPYAEALAHRLGERGHRVTIHATRGPGDGAAYVASLAPDACDVLGVVGGDGTLAEVVDGRRGEVPWPIALVPVGTANLVARELGMPLARDATATAAAIDAGVAWPVDAMRVASVGSTRRWAIANVGIGLDAAIVRVIEAVRGGAEGSGGYTRWVAPILRALRDTPVPRFRVEIDGRRAFAASACIIQNAACYGGLFRLSPSAGLASGALDVVLIRGRTPRDLFLVIAGALFRRVSANHRVRIERADRVRVLAAEPIPVQFDGDAAGTTTVEVERLPAAIRLWKAVREPIGTAI